MAKTADDLEAVRTVTTALEDFSPEEQERIIRWAREKLGLGLAPRILPDTRTPQAPVLALPPRPTQPTDQIQSPAAKDLKTFVVAKNPKSDAQFAATVAYFYRFEAPPEQRRNEIERVILQDACRLAGRKRLKNPRMTLNNAKNMGLLDSGSEAGKFAVNTVGENLVAMTLPSQSDSTAKGKKAKKPKKLAKKTARKKK
jgi:hypothetical protein